MNTKIKEKVKLCAAGAAVGVVNGMFGAGGGMLAVPFLKKMGLDQKSAHKNAVAVILPITLVSATMYVLKDYVTIKESLSYIPTGLLGSLLGTAAIKKISPVWLKKIFGGFMVYAGVRLLLK